MTTHHPSQGDWPGADPGRGPPGHDLRAPGAARRPLADSPFLALDPPQRRQRTLDALKRVLLRESQVQPLAFGFETCTGSILRPRHCRHPGREPTDSPAVAPGQLSAEYQHGWAASLLYSSAWTPCPRECLTALTGAARDDTSLVPLTQLLITRTVGTPSFWRMSVQTLVEAGILTG